MVSLNHIGLYVNDLEASRLFFEKYFGAESGSCYHNPITGFTSYFLHFGDGARLEIMTRPGIVRNKSKDEVVGYAHIALSVGGRENVDMLTENLVKDGYRHIDGPRMTGDGYYESKICDGEGNVIEITV